MLDEKIPDLGTDASGNVKAGVFHLLFFSDLKKKI